MKNIYQDVRKLYLPANQPPKIFKEKTKFSERDLLWFSVGDTLPSAQLRFGMLLDNKYLALEHERGQNRRKL